MCRLFGFTFAEFTVAIAVGEVDDKSDSCPYEEANPGIPWQVVHEVTAGENSEWRDNNQSRTTEFTRSIRTREAKNENAYASDKECTECTDVDHFGDESDREEARADRGDGTADDRYAVRVRGLRRKR